MTFYLSRNQQITLLITILIIITGNFIHRLRTSPKEINEIKKQKSDSQTYNNSSKI